MKKTIILLALVISGFCLAFSVAENENPPPPVAPGNRWVKGPCACTVIHVGRQGNKWYCTAIVGTRCTENGDCYTIWKGESVNCDIAPELI